MIRKGKYNASKFYVDGIRFDSKKEGLRYRELTLLQKAGEIKDLELQKKFQLIPEQREPDTVGKRGGVKKGKIIEREIAYIADFTYKNKDGETVVEDVKGYRGGKAYDVFVIKRKLMLYKYGIRVVEV